MLTISHSYRRLWSTPTRRIRRDRPSTGTRQAIPIPLANFRRRRFHPGAGCTRFVDYERMDRSVDRAILLALGHGLCQDP